MEKSKKIFIVDDDSFTLNTYRQELENLGYTDVTLFHNGTICLYNLYQKPDIIFLDQNMNDISGLEVLKKIKHYNPNIHVIMISGQDSMQIQIDALKSGVLSYIIKGETDSQEIKKAIERIEDVELKVMKKKQTWLEVLKSFFKRPALT